jgi:hypothetical protein
MTPLVAVTKTALSPEAPVFVPAEDDAVYGMRLVPTATGFQPSVLVVDKRWEWMQFGVPREFGW